MPSEVTPQTVRAGAYARYSSDNQRDASIDDQIRMCRAEIERNGWDLVELYADPALSGASTFRPGYQKLLLDASAGAPSTSWSPRAWTGCPVTWPTWPRCTSTSPT